MVEIITAAGQPQSGKIDTPVAANATEDLATPATQSNTNIHWLYQQCQQAKVNMMTDVLPLGMSLVVT